VLTRDHTVLPATRTCIHKWTEPYLSMTDISRTNALWVSVSR